MLEQGGRVREGTWAFLVIGLAAAIAVAAGWMPPMATVALSSLVFAVLAAAASALHRRPGSGEDLRTAPDRVTVVVAAALVALGSDAAGAGPQSLPYAIVAVVIGVVLTAPRSGRLLWPDRLLAVLLAWGVVGSLAGRLFLGQEANLLAFFLPACLALLHVWAPVPLGLTTQARRLTGVFMWSAVLYLVTTFLILVIDLESLPGSGFEHQRVYFLPVAVVAACLLRRRLVLAVVIALAVPSFLAYPSLTAVLVGTSALVTVLATSLRVGPVLLGAVGVIGGVAALLMSASLEELRVSYFARVGKTDNTSTREILLQIGIDRFWTSPVLGDGFTGDIAVPSDVTGSFRLVPVHNDYLQIAISGGAVGGGLFVAWCASTVLFGVVLVRRLRRSGRSDHAALALVATVGIVGMLVAAAFNPVIVDTRASMTLALLYTTVAGVAVATGADRRTGP